MVYTPWGRKELDTTERMNNKKLDNFCLIKKKKYIYIYIKYSSMLCMLERILGIRKQLSGTLLTSFVTLNVVLQTVLCS